MDDNIILVLVSVAIQFICLIRSKITLAVILTYPMGYLTFTCTSMCLLGLALTFPQRINRLTSQSVDWWNGYKPLAWTLSGTERNHLADFIHKVYSRASIYRNYTKYQINKHQVFVEEFIHDLCTKLGEQYPAFKVDILNTGSFYDGTKVGKPDEFEAADDMSDTKVSINDKLFVQTVNKLTAKSEINEDEIDFHNRKIGVMTEVVIILLGLMLKLPIVWTEFQFFIVFCIVFIVQFELTLLLIFLVCCKVAYDIIKYSPSPSNIRRALLEAVSECINNDDNIPQYLDDSFSENQRITLNGPCVTLKIKGPICPASIDLGFCFEKQSSSNEDDVKCLVLPYPRLLRHIPANGWTLTRYKHNYKGMLTPGHKRILMVLKFIANECINSHLLKTFVLLHQRKCETCDNPSDWNALAGCLNDITQLMFECYETKENNKQVSILYVSYKSIKDMDFPQVNVLPGFEHYLWYKTKEKEVTFYLCMYLIARHINFIMKMSKVSTFNAGTILGKLKFTLKSIPPHYVFSKQELQSVINELNVL
ncbi:unnamed protein product [Owenia fusiformis]|uniref:Uncharacterized protein n=1 Tax=Owenia fusiformis TaxID=6347 RepID=A0A8J1UW90_OWEFU|nr:unnamed protein product [Owenia fusiformis]